LTVSRSLWAPFSIRPKTRRWARATFIGKLCPDGVFGWTMRQIIPEQVTGSGYLCL